VNSVDAPQNETRKKATIKVVPSLWKAFKQSAAGEGVSMELKLEELLRRECDRAKAANRRRPATTA
jgi:hypothetical protein